MAGYKHLYRVQLLTDEDQSRVVRDALAYWLENQVLAEDERDTGWSVLADLTKKMRDEAKRQE